MAFSDSDLFGTIIGHLGKIGGGEAKLRVWDRVLWREVYDSALAEVNEGSKPDVLVNLTYIENKRMLARLAGDEGEFTRLSELTSELGAKYPIPSTERKG